MQFFWIIITLAVVITSWTAFWLLLNFLSGKSKWQSKFVAGKIPESLPEGFYPGSAYLLGNRPVPWMGKSFEKENQRGFNIFTPTGAVLLKIMTPFYRLFRKNADGNTDAYYFRTSTSQGFKDKDIETFKLDYNSPENPFLIRIILDEIVETGPDEYLGKVHMKVFPRYYATVGFFGLRKTTQIEN
jgi:hypothetical protein